MKLLDTIDEPRKLHQLSRQQLIQLCGELREQIIETVSKTGGHLASNLGVVELTVALHSVINAPVDKLIWDVGHQAYAHKLLTGRRERFHTLRQYKGISGFPARHESVYDPFTVGHSSTSISAALGYALARDRLNLDYNVVAVLGDGALTGGMAFEALNHAGHIGT
ncbi:MAG: 1-deoxy-D-xylulose-5-phosphate synthase, partial [Firmicutes bacterium]|nr:1-deoxy-D-xylulose-5-phosphate synthase [Bacillota bacterium]